MSGCSGWRESVLGADLEELRGTAGSELSAHLAGCPMCRTVADAVLRTSAGLASSLEATASREEVDVEAVLTRLERSASPHFGELPKSSRPPRAALWLPFAAAALVAGLLALPTAEPPMGPSPPPPPPTTPPAVDVPDGRNVVVIPTSDPQITVLWFF